MLALQDESTVETTAVFDPVVRLLTQSVGSYKAVCVLQRLLPRYFELSGSVLRRPTLQHLELPIQPFFLPAFELLEFADT